MKNLIQSSVAFVIFLLISFPVFTQEIRYVGPSEEASFFPIGFSNDGTKFAYGWFEGTQMISSGSQLVIRIQDLKTDKILFESWKNWDEGNVGMGEEGYYPKNAKEAWKHVAEVVKPKLAEFQILEGAGAGVQDFPMGEVPFIWVELKDTGDYMYEVYATSDQLGEKRISREDGMRQNVTIEGYVWNPPGTRIAVVMNERSFDPYSKYWVIGCHATGGFKHDMSKLPYFESMNFTAFLGTNADYSLMSNGIFSAFGEAENVGGLDQGTWEYDASTQEIVFHGESEVYRWKLIDRNHIQVPTHPSGELKVVEVKYYAPK